MLACRGVMGNVLSDGAVRVISWSDVGIKVRSDCLGARGEGAACESSS
jgi:hypothetical protein